MILSGIQISHFRNIERLFYEPVSGLNIFVGDNGQGKTNILEAICVLAQGSSFRIGSDSDFVNYNHSNYELSGDYCNSNRKFTATLKYQTNGNKTFKINGKKARFNNPDRLRVVTFTPDDLFLIKGSPSMRRHFLDLALRQISSDYSQHMDDYIRLLKRRNSVLRKLANYNEELNIIDDLFCERAAHITIARLNYINVLNDTMSRIYFLLNPRHEKLRIRYALSFAMNNGTINLDQIKNALAGELVQKRKMEIGKGSTLFGRHRDDVFFYISERQARHFASQGQQRNLAVSLKLAELEAFFAVKGYYPLFLLDEVLAELDEEKKGLLLEFLSKAAFQSFLSSVSLGVLEKANKAKICMIKDGSLL